MRPNDDDIPTPEPPAGFGEKRGSLFVSDNETIDALIDSLRANASAQDYPPPEEPRRRDQERYRPHHPYRAAYTDQRSLTHDAHLDEHPVPGYADFPKHIAQTLNFENPHAQQIPQTSPPHGRRRP